MPVEIMTTRFPGQADITPDRHPRSHRIYTVRDLLMLPDDLGTWIVRDLIPASQRILVVGKGASYKTSVVFDLCIAAASKGQGRLLNHLPVDAPGPVLVISTEGSIYTNKQRIVGHIRAYNLDPHVLQQNLFFCQQSFVLDDPADAWELNNLIAEMRPSLVVMDPLDSFFSGDENSAKETKMFRRLVDFFIDNYACSVLVIHHVGKDTSKKEPRGSSAWYDWADTCIHFDKKKITSKSEKVAGRKLEFDIAKVVVTKQRNGPDGHVFTIVPQINEAVGMITFDFHDEGSDKRVAHRYMQQLLYKRLQQFGPHTAGMLEDALPLGRDKIRTILKELMAAGFVDQRGQIAVTVEGRGRRAVSGWRCAPTPTMVDAAITIIRAEEANIIEDECLFNPPNIIEKVTPDD